MIFDFGFSISDLNGGDFAVGGDFLHPKRLPVSALSLASRPPATTPIENPKSKVENPYA